MIVIGWFSKIWFEREVVFSLLSTYRPLKSLKSRRLLFILFSALLIARSSTLVCVLLNQNIKYIIEERYNSTMDEKETVSIRNTPERLILA